MGFLFVGLGGACGAVLRYAISLIPIKTDFPVLTLATNLLGALIIGFIVGFAEKREVTANTMLFAKTGLCGGFTTFSTFSLEAYTMIKSGAYAGAAVYAVLSLVLCVAGVFAGAVLGKRLCR